MHQCLSFVYFYDCYMDKEKKVANRSWIAFND